MSEQPEETTESQFGENEADTRTQRPDYGESADQLLAALNALDNLCQVAISDKSAHLEAQHQLGKLIGAIQILLTGPVDEDVQPALFAGLKKLATLVSIPEPVIAPPELEPELEEAQPNRSIIDRLNDYSYAHANQATDDLPLPKAERRRVVVACLESGEIYMRSTVEVSRSFDPASWQVTNLGANTPIMALTSTVKEVKPAVVVLLIHRPLLLTETRRLIADLKKSLIGLKILAAGPLFAAQPHLGNSLGADLYGVQLDQIAKLAHQALSPLKTLGDPLILEDTPTFEIATPDAPEKITPPVHIEESLQDEKQP